MYFFLRTDWHGGTPHIRQAIGSSTIHFNLRQARLKKRSRHAYIYRTRGTLFSSGDAERLAKAFEGAGDLGSAIRQRGIFHNDLEAFGAPPDVDGDPRIFILVDEFAGPTSVPGYFWSINEWNSASTRPSHRSELLHIKNQAGWEDEANTVAHEFQHCIHYRHDSPERPWVNEGCSTLAEDLCDYFVGLSRRRLEIYRRVGGSWLRSLRQAGAYRAFRKRVRRSRPAGSASSTKATAAGR
jgi:hypothetical protein